MWNKHFLVKQYVFIQKYQFNDTTTVTINQYASFILHSRANSCNRSIIDDMICKSTQYLNDVKSSNNRSRRIISAIINANTLNATNSIDNNNNNMNIIN